MSRLVKYLLLIACLIVLALPSAAQAFNANRVVTTTCYVNGSGQNVIWAYLQSSGASRYTTVPCNGWVPDVSKPWYVVNRPGTDAEGAQRSARAWFPKCEPLQYNQAYPHYANGKTYGDWYFHVCT